MKNPLSRLLLIGDFGKDLDDEHALLLTVQLQRLGLTQLIGVVANLEPACERARLAKGMLNLLHAGHIPVSVGTACFLHGNTDPHETDVAYLADSNELWGSGQELIQEMLKTAPPQSVTLVLNSGMTDAAQALRAFPKLLKEKLAGVTIMGGIVINPSGEAYVDSEGFLEPALGENGAANNCFDAPAARFTYRRFQELQIPMTILTRFAAYGCSIPYSLCHELASTGHPIGMALKRRQPHRYTDLWKAVHAPAGSPVRGALPLDRTPQWFLNRYCEGVGPSDVTEQIEPYLKNIHLYDPLTIFAAIPELRDRFYTPHLVSILDTTHRIIGLAPQNNDIRNEQELRIFLVNAELTALRTD